MRVELTRENTEWIEGSPDSRSRKGIVARVRRLAEGNPGAHRHLGEGEFELEIDVGPGYRLYYSLLGVGHVVVLLGGDERTQARDAARAVVLGRMHKKRWKRQP